ncbi:DUF2802 domain-containing protein [Oceanimonas sp. NS1]|nr:DUF2802 domain-containing protein [Oceanimonas sp. NS1]
MIGETALILAALALLLALAAIAIAWQMWRRSQRKLDAMSTLMRELSRSRDSYRKQLEELQTANIGMGRSWPIWAASSAVCRSSNRSWRSRIPEQALQPGRPHGAVGGRRGRDHGRM